MKINNKTNRFGFTMLELLVVIAIIAVLSSLIIPAVSKMLEKGRIVQCVNNLKMLHTAAVGYSIDHSGNLPHPASETWMWIDSDGDSDSGSNKGWVDWISKSDPRTLWWDDADTNGTRSIRNGSLFDYLGVEGDEAVYVCPSMARLAKKTLTGDKSNVIRSYGMNASLQSGRWIKSYHNIDGASRVVMFAEQGFEVDPNYLYALTSDGEWSEEELPDPDPSNAGHYIKRDFRNIDGCIDWRKGRAWSADSGTTTSECEHIGEYHNGRGNAIFCDGHVERIKYQYTRYICSGGWDNHKIIGPVVPDEADDPEEDDDDDD